jgi:hypothetical protein
MRVRFGRFANGDHYATTTLPMLGGSVKLIARVSNADLKRMYGDNIGFKLSFKSLGKALKVIGKPATLLKLTAMAGALALGQPEVAAALGPSVIMSIKSGMAAKRVLTLAVQGDKRAQAIVAKARQAASNGEATASTPGIAPSVMRYLVTLQRLKAA